MTIVRPLCHRPGLGIVCCLLLAAGCGWLAFRGILPALFQFAAGGGLIGAVLFLLLAIFRPAQRVVITEEDVRWTGVLSRSVMRFDEVRLARLRPDPDSSNYHQLLMESKNGEEMVIHAGFLNLDSEGVIPLMEERLKRVGLTLERS